MGSSVNDVLTKEEYDKIWEYARQEEVDRVLFVLLAQLGLRRGEAAHVRSDWIDMQKQKLHIPEKDEKTGFTAKSDAAARTIPFKNLVKAAKVIPNYFEFNSDIPVASRTVYNRVQKWASEAGVTTRVYPHALRATAATKFAEAGMSGQGLREIMGWESLKTAKRYIESTGRAAEKFLKENGRELY